MDPGARRKSRSVALFLSLSVWIYSQALGGEPLSVQETTPAARPCCLAPLPSPGPSGCRHPLGGHGSPKTTRPEAREGCAGGRGKRCVS